MDSTTTKLAPRLIGETDEMFTAFIAYAEMGASRSLAKVAKKLGKGVGTLHGWSKRNNWQARAIALWDEANAKSLENLKERLFEDVEKLRDAKNDVLTEMVDRVKNKGKLTVSELRTVLDAIKTELGEPTSIAKGTWTDEKPNPFAGILDSFFAPKHADAEPQK